MMKGGGFFIWLWSKFNKIVLCVFCIVVVCDMEERYCIVFIIGWMYLISYDGYVISMIYCRNLGYWKLFLKMMIVNRVFIMILFE